MAQMFTGSICLTDLVLKAKEGHSAFTRGNNSKVYLNILQWLNDEADQYGNHISIQLNSKKDKKEQEGKFYIGHAKKMEGGGGSPISPQEAKQVEDDLDNLPF